MTGTKGPPAHSAEATTPAASKPSGSIPLLPQPEMPHSASLNHWLAKSTSEHLRARSDALRLMQGKQGGECRYLWPHSGAGGGVNLFLCGGIPPSKGSGQMQGNPKNEKWFIRLPSPPHHRHHHHHLHQHQHHHQQQDHQHQLCHHGTLTITTIHTTTCLTHKLNVDRCFVASISFDSQRKLSPLLPTFYWQTKHMGLGQGQKAVWPNSRTCDGKDWGCLSSLTPQGPATLHKDSGVFAECRSLFSTGLEDPNDR